MAGVGRALDWHADPVVILGLCALGAAWWAGLQRVRRRGGAVSADRRWAFAAAYAVLVLALLSPLSTVSEERFSAHMVQHLLLLYVAAPLLALCAPVTLALQVATPRTRQGVLLPILHSRALRAVTHPVVAFTLFAAVMYGTHFSAVYDAALRSSAVHGAEHLAYLAAASLFWWPVVRRDPVPGTFPWPARLLYLVVAFPLQSFLGLAIYSSDRVLYAGYLGLGSRAEALADQQLAGVIMWVGGDLLTLTAIGIGIGAWMRHEDRAAVREDARLDAEATARRPADAEEPA
ncbi:MAG TPA: cytochrome c oxidase assembly protein [Mycobacteriales bacterium]|nr:cytochrome c oxidase assembly protein [Mycobacteriales bacterium]